MFNRDRSKSSNENDIWRFLLIALQLGLVLYVIDLFHLEEDHGLNSLLPIIFGGFIIHSWLPKNWRPPFFFLLTLTAILFLFGAKYGSILIGIGLGLIAICHLPLNYWLRIGLILVAVSVLAAFRSGWMPSDWAPFIMPILGSMFMFRLIIYLYDLKNESIRPAFWQRLNYFFMLPNVCLPLFPIIDYVKFHRSHYSADAYEIYQKGIRWMFRGVTHLLIYRVIYYYIIPSPTEVNDLNGLVLLMMCSFMLYTRVSGLFHLITGILCLFGYNMPPTHNLYFLASGFNDFWRRANIYWKDFMMKVFYYPLFLKMQRFGQYRGIIFTMLPLFVISWLFHSYQWFWIRGSFPITLIDGIFWCFFGLMVLTNSLMQAKWGRRRSLGKKRWSFGRALRLSLQTVSMFSLMCFLWVFYTSNSIPDWLALLSKAANYETIDIVRIVSVWISAVAVGVVFQYLNSQDVSLPSLKNVIVFRPAVLTSVSAFLLLLVGIPQASAVFNPQTHDFIESIRMNRLNSRDVELFEKGYYESLMGTNKFTSQLWRAQLQEPQDWKLNLRENGLAAPVEDMRLTTLNPNMDHHYKRAKFRTNQHGMRDKAYDKVKPASTYRIALLGGSHVMGPGVRDEDTYQWMLEDQLNLDSGEKEFAQYEILNFAKSSWISFQHLLHCQKQVVQFAPDAVFYVTHFPEEIKTVERLTDCIMNSGRIDFPYLAAIADSAGVHKDMAESEIQRRLKPYAGKIVQWTYQQFADLCKASNAMPVWVYQPLPKTNKLKEPESKIVERLKGYAVTAGFEVLIDLSGVFDGREYSRLQLAPWDKHPNKIGHQLIAERFYQELINNSASLKMGVQPVKAERK